MLKRARIEVHVSGELTSRRLVPPTPSLAWIQALFYAVFNVIARVAVHKQAFSVPGLVEFTAAHWLGILDNESRHGQS